MLKSDKLPYLFTILIALVAYSVTKIADRLEKLPILEYSVAKQSGSKDCNGTHHVTLTNLSTERAITDLVIRVAPQKPGGRITEQSMHYEPPLIFMPEEIREMRLCPDAAEFQITGLPPYCVVDLCVTVQDSDTVSVHYHYTRQVFRFMPRGLQTFIVRYELNILVGLLGASFLLLVTYAIFLWRTRSPADNKGRFENNT